MIDGAGLEDLPLFASLAKRKALTERLTLLVRALRAAGRAGLTTRDLAAVNGSVAPHSDVAELRGKGFAIECERAGRTESGRAVYRYRLTKEPS